MLTNFTLQEWILRSNVAPEALRQLGHVMSFPSSWPRLEHPNMPHCARLVHAFSAACPHLLDQRVGVRLTADVVDEIGVTCLLQIGG